MPDFTFDRVTPHVRDWERWLAPYRDHSVSILEVGSCEGRSALWFLAALPRSKILCVDPLAWEPTHERFVANTASAAAAGRLQLLRQTSTVALLDLVQSGAAYQVAYVDGDHHEAAAYLDVATAWRLLSVGGLLLVDDTNLANDKLAGGAGAAVLRLLRSMCVSAELHTSTVAFGQFALRKLA